MAKILLCSDQHLHPHGKSIERLEEGLACFSWIYDVARERGIKSVISLGDLFHDREEISIRALHRAYEIIEKASQDGIQTYLLLGNHDMYFRESFSIHSLKSFSKVAHVIDTPQVVEIEGTPFDFLPFVEDPASSLKYFPKKKRNKILCSHLAIEGGVMNYLWGTTYQKEDGVNEDALLAKEPTVEKDVLEGYDLVLLGHFHSRQCMANKSNKIHYVGSPMQLHFGETEDQKGVDILDTETLELEFVENDFSPRYLIIPYDGKNDKVINEQLKNNRVRVVIPADFGNIDILDLKKKFQEGGSPLALEILSSKTKLDINEKVIEEAVILSEDKTEMIRRYVKATNLPDGMKPELLVRIGSSMAAQEI